MAAKPRIERLRIAERVAAELARANLYAESWAAEPTESVHVQVKQSPDGEALGYVAILSDGTAYLAIRDHALTVRHAVERVTKVIS